MPELPEVERARRLIQDSLKGYKIKSVDAKEDKIVYTGGTDHAEFAKEVEGRTITGCERKGKMFWLTLSGDGRLPVMHFGMTGMVQLKGQEPTWYRRRPKETSNVWPPKPGSVSDEPRSLAFIDARRLGRLRLVPHPVLSHPPLSQLGFDPILSHPTLDEFKDLLAKKKGTVKGWAMILYQSRLHPSTPIPSLTEENLQTLHHWIRKVPEVAVGVNADSKFFPEDWLFRWRWGKGKKHDAMAKKAKAGLKGSWDPPVEVKKEGRGGGGGGDDENGGEDITPQGVDFLALPDGSPATITFIEVGGRTTAVVKELQKMPEGVDIKPKVSKGGKGGKGGGGGSTGGKAATGGRKRKPKHDEVSELAVSSLLSDNEAESSLSEEEEVVAPSKTTPRQKAAAAKMVKAEEPSPAKKVSVD
ncbi:hypothetical protein JCM24511_00094 [Saitozyma sp. JCM 24511]|nr:hypothetical protein JCM24511_00094 [Saitozyma sp. JCM 24511]